MTQILTPSLTLADNITVRKLRELPVKGTITKKEGDFVRADEIVARADLPGDLEIVRVAERLGLEPFEVSEALRVKIGQTVAKGDLLAEHAGLFGLLRSEVRSEVSGTLEFFAERTGHLGIRLPPKHVELTAYVSGRVTEIVAGKSATIESAALLVQGIFGVGGERQGTIEILNIARESRVSVSAIPAQCSGKILVGGTRPDLSALKAASDRGATGFVTGAIDDEVLKGYVGYDVGVAVTGDEQVPMSLVITEGFGEIPISERVVELLKSVKGKLASLNGTTQVRAGAVRPEVIVCFEGQQAQAQMVAGQGLELGRIVRLIRFPYFGRKASIVELPHAPEKIATGAVTRVLRARLENGEVVTIPRANVELAS